MTQNDSMNQLKVMLSAVVFLGSLLGKVFICVVVLYYLESYATVKSKGV